MPSTDCKPSGQLGVGIVVVAARVVVSATTVVSAKVVVSVTTVVSTTVDVASVVSATVVPITVDVADVVVDEYASLSSICSIVMGVGEMAVGLADGLLEVGFSVRISVVMAEIVVAIGVVSTTVVSTSVSDAPPMRLSSATVLLSSPSSCEGARG